MQMSDRLVIGKFKPLNLIFLYSTKWGKYSQHGDLLQQLVRSIKKKIVNGCNLNFKFQCSENSKVQKDCKKPCHTDLKTRVTK